MRYTKITLFSLFISFFTQNLIAQQDYPVNRDQIDRLESFTGAEWQDFINAGNDLNKQLEGTKKEPYTIFHLFAHNFGFYCMDDWKEIVYLAVQTNKKPLIDPLFFLADPYQERKKDILEYYTLLKKYGHPVKEADFNRIQFTYYYEDNLEYINDAKKTLLIYACQFNYTKTAKKLAKKTKNINHVDPTGKTALMYAYENKNQALINTLIKQGAKKNQ